MRFQSRTPQLVGLLAFVVGIASYTVFGWRFDSSGNSVVTALGIAGALVAVALTVLRARRGSSLQPNFRNRLTG